MVIISKINDLRNKIIKDLEVYKNIYDDYNKIKDKIIQDYGYQIQCFGITIDHLKLDFNSYL